MEPVFNKTKIIATVGPASSAKEILLQMIHAGVDVFRLNFSHGAYDVHQKTIDTIKQINEEHKYHIGILVDLQGPKLRIGLMENEEACLKDGEEIIITTEKCTGSSKKVYITYPEFPKDVAIGDTVLIDDGKIKLTVVATNKKDTVRARIVHGGVLSSKKGVNLPNTKISLPCLTKKDLEDLEFALKNDVEWIGLSFVRSVTDIVELKHIIKTHKKPPRVIAKIEKPEAIKEIDNIIDMADAIMVARGDLGVEMPLEQVSLTQKMLVKKSIAAYKPIVIATQMMESMINNFAPTRAEVSDVTNSVIDGADALMLSGETSVGKYPVKVIEQMQKIIASVEKDAYVYNREYPPSIVLKTFVSDSICFNACRMAEQSGAKAIITMTRSGYTAFKIASHRPQANIFMFTDQAPLLKIMSLVWGIRAFYYDKYVSTDQTISDSINILKEQEYIKHEDMVINIASVPIYEKGRANMIKLSYV